MDIKKAFGKVLGQIRKEAGISQEKLAFDADLDRSYVSKLENGVYQPSLSKIFDLARVLGVRPSEVVERVEDIMKEE